MTDRDRFDDTIDRLVEGGSPKSEAAGLTPEERRMVQMAQLLKGANDAAPSAEFSTRLRERLKRSQRQGISRRAAVLSGIGALAAGMAAGVGLDHELGSPTKLAYPDLVGANGHGNVGRL